MNRTLRDFLAAREAEIKAQISDLQRELRELRAARAAIDSPDVASRPTAARSSGAMNQRDMMAAVLDDRPEGGTGVEVANWVRERFNVDVAEGSVSPQLSRLRREGRANLDPVSKKWLSTKHVAPSEVYDTPVDADREQDAPIAVSDLPDASN